MSGGTSLFFEAPALQPHKDDFTLGFYCHVFDFIRKTVESTLFALGRSGVPEASPVTARSFQLPSATRGRLLDLTEDFIKRLADAGANLTHANKENIEIDDLFVYPDLHERISDPTVLKPISSESLIIKIEEGERLLVTGEEQSGKSTLLFQYFKVLRDQGWVPVYLDIANVTLKAKDNAEKRIQQAIKSQYAQPQTVLTFPKEKLVLLLDNVDRLRACYELFKPATT